MRAVAQHADTVGIRRQLIEFGRDDQQRHPVGTQLLDQADHLGMRADIDPAGGFVQDQDIGVHQQPARQDHLLLVAPRQQPDRLFGIRGADIEAADEVRGDAVLFGPRHAPLPAATGLKGEQNVFAHAQFAHNPVGLPVLGAKTEPGADRIAG